MVLYEYKIKIQCTKRKVTCSLKTRFKVEHALVALNLLKVGVPDNT